MDKSASGFRAILSQQVLSRLITFILNIYLTRISTLGTMGLVLDMDLYLSTVLFLARESVRLSALRNPYTDKLQLLVNISYIPLALGSVLIFAFMNFSNPVLGLYSVAALIELASEPFYNLLQFKLLYGKRVHVQGLAFFLQCLCTGLYYFASLKNGKVSVEDGLHAHAYSQIVFSCILFGGYYLSLKNEQVSFFPRAVLEKDKWIYFDTYQLGICRNFMLQTLAKHLVTVGDKIILVFLGVANAEKGAYRLVSDLGSLVARILFQPLEEISRGLFAKNLTNTAHLDNYQQLAKDALDWLVLLVQFNIVLGSIFASFGTNYCRLLLQILFDKGNTDAVQALQFYCIYVPFMGINGITEAFVQAVGDSKIIQRQIWIFAACWIMFLISSYLFVVILDYGSVGLIMANIVNMTMRIMFSLQYIFSFYNAKGETAVSFETFQFGNKLLWLSVVIGWAVMKDFDRGIGSIKDIIIHLGAGCVCFFIVFFLLYRYEKHRFASLFTVRKNSKKELK